MSEICCLIGTSTKPKGELENSSVIASSRNIFPLGWLALFTTKNVVELNIEGTAYPFLCVATSTAQKNLSAVMSTLQERFPAPELLTALENLAGNLQGIPYKYILIDDQQVRFDLSIEDHVKQRCAGIAALRAGNRADCETFLRSQFTVKIDVHTNHISTIEDGSRSLLIQEALAGQIEEDWTFFGTLRKDSPNVELPAEVRKLYLSEEARQKTSHRISGVQAIIPGFPRLSQSQWLNLIKSSAPEDIKRGYLVWDPIFEPSQSYDGGCLKLGYLNSGPPKIYVRFVKAEETPYGAYLNIQNPPVETSELFRTIVKLLESFPGAVVDRY